VARIKEHLRPYDLITRLGGDEFLCAISDVTLPDARRLHKVAAAPAAAAGGRDEHRLRLAHTCRANETERKVADQKLIDRPSESSRDVALSALLVLLDHRSSYAGSLWDLLITPRAL
jgi:GGDEF domain-containing protein